jgi:uncharacterized membrane protein YkvA (DUF1232 family)
MHNRTSSRELSSSNRPKPMTIDPACWPTSYPSNYDLPGQTKPKRLIMETLPRFPNSLFQFKTYDGAKALTAIFLLLSSTYLLAGFLGFIIDHTAWVHDLLYGQPLSNSATHPLWWKVWKPIGATLHHLASYVDLAFRAFIFVCTYCLAWATFDPRNVEGYVMGFFNTLLGLAYLLAPMDMIPDIVPMVGGIDDAFLGFGTIALGISSIYRNKFREVKTNTILELIDDGNNQKALKMLLEDKGIAINQK